MNDRASVYGQMGRWAWVAGLAAFLAGSMGATVTFAGDGTFPDSLATSIALEGSDPSDLAIGDFNNDGRQDLAVAEQDDENVEVLLGPGDGTFFPPVPFAVGIEPEGVVVADFDGDGDEDIAAVGGLPNALVVRLGEGNGTFQPRVETALTGRGLSIATGDFDGNGTTDLAIGQDNATMSIHLGVGNGTFSAPAALSAANPASVTVGDFDGDGDEDVASATDTAVQVRLNNGAGTFGSLNTLNLGDTGGASVVAADFDSDGDDDLAVCRQSSIAIFRSSGTGTFTRADFDAGAGGSPRGIAVADANSDGALDRLTTLAFGKQSVMLGDGSGGFAPAAAQAQASSISPRRPVVGDFDADGNEDLAFVDDPPDLVTRRGAGPPADAGNLLVNGGGEAAAGSTAARRTAEAPSVPGWSSSGPLTHVRYGAAGGFFSRLASARWGGQEAFFAGGAAASSSATQTVNISSSSASVDAGLATVRLSGYLGGYRATNDAMAVVVTFSDGSGQALGAPLQIGPVTAADRHNLTTLLRRTADAAVPPGTRSISVTLIAERTDGTYNDAYADRLGLFLTAPAPTPPGGGADTTPPETTITKEPKAKSSKAGVKYKFESSEPNSTFECKLDKGKFKPCDTGKAKYKKLDFGKHKFAVVATDAAGNTDSSPAKDKFKRKH